MLIKKHIFFILVVAVVTAFSGCSGGGSSNDDNSSQSVAPSYAQKGPFVKGTLVKAYEIVDGERTQNSVTTRTTDNTGLFSLNTPWNGITELVITGSYLDENSGDLRADGNLSAIMKRSSNSIYGRGINVFTHIAAARILQMLKDGASYEVAKEESEKLVKKMFNLDLANGMPLSNLNVVTNNSDLTKSDNAQLLRVSAALLQSKNPSAYLEALREDIRDGKIDGIGVGALKRISENIKSLNMDKIDSILGNFTDRKQFIPSDASLRAGKLPLNAKISFDDIYDANPSQQYFTKKISLVGFEGNVTVSISGGTARALILHKDGTQDQASINSPTSAESGAILSLTQFAASSYSTMSKASVKIGGREFEWNIITKANPNVVDTTPNSFNLGIASNAEPQTIIQSKAITVSGLSDGIAVDMNISGGKYSVNGEANCTTPSQVMNGDSIVVSLTAANSYLAKRSATLNIGGVGGDFTVVTRAKNATPQMFTPATKYNVALNTSYETQYFTMSGYEGGLDLDVVNGEVQLEGETTWRNHISQIPAGYKVKFRQISANSYNTTNETVITLGSLHTTFTTVTQANPSVMDYVPNPVTFQTQYDVALSTDEVEVISNEVTISGIANGNGATLRMNSTRDYFQVNNGEWTHGPVSAIRAGDKVRVKIRILHKHPGHYLTSLQYLDDDQKYKILGTFNIYTAPLDTTPDTFSFNSINDAELFKTYFSNEITISGLDDDANISATILGQENSSNYQYSINDEAWKTAPATVVLKNGDIVKLKLASSNQQGVTESMFVNYNDTSVAYSVTTNVAPKFYNHPSFENIEVNDTIAFTPQVRDTQAITFSLENAPDWLDVNTSTGEISGKVASGSYKNVKLIALDSGGLSSALVFDIFADVVPTITSSGFGKIFYLDDNSSEKNVFGFSFKIADVDNNISDLNVTLKNEIIHENLSPDGLNKGFSESRITCDLSGNCGARIAFDFARKDGLHPSMRTRHYITVSDGDKNATNYVDVWFAPVKPELSGEQDQILGFTTKGENAYRHYSFVPNNAGNKAESWSIVNRPIWADFNTSSGELSGTPSPDQNGTYAGVKVTATNDRGSDTFTFSITVVEKTPPKVFELEDYYGVEINQYYDTFVTVDWLADGQSAAISSSGYDGQATHSGFTVNGSNDVASVKNGDIVRVGHLSSNEYNTELHTTITIGDDSDDFITRTKASADTKLPLIVGSPKMSANIHERYSYTPQMSNDTTKYAPATKPFEIQNKPDWAAFNTATGELSGTPTAMGVYKNVKIIAHGDNGMDDITFDITVSNDGPSMHSNNLSLETENLDFTYNDNSDWRNKITEVSLFGCAMQSTATVLDSSDYTFSEGALQLHVSTSQNVALHVPTFGGYRLIIKATNYTDDNVYTEMVSDGQYGVSATLDTTTVLTEENLDGAKVQIVLNNALKFKDNVLDSSNFTLTEAPEATHITNAKYIDATHAELTLSYNGVDFDSDAVLSVAINTGELNTPCANITTNSVPVVAIIEKPYINMLYPDDPSEGDKFGISVADRNSTIAVGAYSGVYIFKKGSDGNYTQTQKITPPETLNTVSSFGDSVALDGDYLLIGCIHNNLTEDAKENSGVALVYKQDTNGVYQQIADLTPADNEAYDNFGNAVAISKDMILVGATNALREPDRGGRGKAYLYKNDGNDNFILVETITRDNGKPFDGFGHDVAITHGFAGTNEENTSYLLVGSYVLPDYDSATNTTDTKEELGAGFANYYLYKDGTLSTPVVVSADDSTTLSDHFGSGVAFGGNLAVIGSSVRLYSYARGEGDALNARVKIDNAGAGISGGNVAVNFTGFDNKARNVIVAGRKSFVSNEDGSAYTAYESRLNDNDDLGYSASLSGFEVARGDYSNSNLVSNGGAVLVTNAYENITSTTSSAATPPTISEPQYGYGLATDYVDFAFTADDTWKNAVTNVLYKAGANAQYVVLGANDYTITSDNNIRLQTAQSTNVALHTPYETKGSLLVKADGYLDDVVTISRVGGGSHAIKAELSSDTALNENNLDGAVIHITLSNTLEFADAAIESVNLRLIGAPTGVNIDTVSYNDATHADVTLAFDGTDFDDNATLGITLNAAELNAYEGVASENTLDVTAVVETAADGVTLQAVDPYVTYARFWYDKNNNGQVEDYELSTYSDENGSFNFSTAIDEDGIIRMVDSGLHDGRPYDGNLTLEYNTSAPAFISPVTTLEQKGFTLDEIRTLLVDAGVSSDLNVSELIMNPMDMTILPEDGNMSSFSSADTAKFRRIFIGNAALNAVVSAQDAYGLDKASLQDMLTHVYSMGEGGEGSPAPTSLLAYAVSLGNLILSDGNLQSYNARGEARIYVSMTNLLHEVVQNYIYDNGSLDDGILYALKNNITDNYLNIIEAMTNAYADALAAGVSDPKIEWVYLGNHHRPLWMLSVTDMQNVFDNHVFNTIVIEYKDANGDAQKVEFDIDNDYLENSTHLGQWSISNGKVLANSKEIEFRGTKLRIDGIDYDVLDVGSYLPDGSLNNFYEEIPEFSTISTPVDGANYIDVNSSFMMKVVSNTLSTRLQEHTTCSLSQDYNGNVDLNVTFGSLNTIIVTPQAALKHNLPYTLNCGISYGDDYAGKSVGFRSEELFIPIFITGQTKSYNFKGEEVSTCAVKDDGCYQTGAHISRTDNGDSVIDNISHLEWEDDGASDTNDARRTQSSYAVCSTLTLNSKSDWRAPSAREIMSLFDFQGSGVDGFENISNSSTGYWTLTKTVESTTYNSDEYLYAVMPKLTATYNEGYDKMHMCVRTVSEPTEDAPEMEKVDDVVIDYKNSLEWEDDINVTLDGEWATAINLCEDLVLGGHDDWRMPNINELARTAGHSVEPSSDVNQEGYPNSTNTVFTATAFGEEFWSSTTDMSDTTKAYYLDGRYGTISSASKDTTRKTRCVRTK